MKLPIAQHSQKQGGSILLEGMIAVLIFSLGVLGLIGLQAASMKNATQAKERMDASLVAEQRLATIWLDRTNMAAYQENSPGTSISDLPNGKRITSINGDIVTITVTWRMPGQTTDNSFSTMARIKGSSDA